ncbi:MAG: phosphatase PAP2 family protein [Clostridia bacterium]|nr:phosphatase PAP2 family protein [Clostridia bacterium]
MIDFMLWLENFRTPFFNKIFALLTILGDETVILVIMCIIFWCTSKQAGYKLGLAVVFNAAVNGAIKDIFMVTRPYDLDNRLHPLEIETTGDTYSMPSGHTQNVTALWFSLSLSYKKKVFYIFTFTLSALVAFSRIYLSVHTPLDVLVGFTLAIILTFLCHYVIDLCSSKKIYYPMFLLILPVAVTMFFVQTENYFKLAGLCIAFVIGYYIENKYIQFTVKTTLVKQFFKILIGLTIALLIKILLKAVLPDQIIFHLARYVLLGLSVVVLSPFLFKKLNL